MVFFNDNPASLEYFIPTMVLEVVILLSLIVINYFLNKKKYVKTKIKLDNERIFLTLPLIEQKKAESYIKEKKRKQWILKLRYLTVFLLTRSSTWAKSPFMFTLFSKYHGLSITDIGILYVIDAFSSLIFGPLTGNWADKYGRKLFCICYCLSIVISMTFRSIRYVPLLYISQIITGFGAGLIFTTYESWVIYEAEKQLGEKKYSFLEKLFKSQNMFDTITSLFIGVFSAFLYSNYGILAPILLSIFLAVLSILIIVFYWEENKPNSNEE